MSGRGAAVMAGMATLLALALAAPAAAKDNKGMPTLYKLADQVAEIAGLTVPQAKQQCANWAWAAVVEAVLTHQQVALPQELWVMRAHGGEVCVEAAPDFERITRAVSGEFVLDDGRKLRLTSRYRPGAPTNIGELASTLKLGRPPVVFWRGHAYLLQGAAYDEYIYPNAQRLYVVQRLTLLDPFQIGEKQRVEFINSGDAAAELDGILELEITWIEGQSWKR